MIALEGKCRKSGRCFEHLSWWYTTQKVDPRFEAKGEEGRDPFHGYLLLLNLSIRCFNYFVNYRLKTRFT